MTTLFRFKSNPKTIVERTSAKDPASKCNQVQIVWSESFEHGGNANFIYSNVEEILIPLTPSEVAEILAKRQARNMPTNIGLYE